MSDVYINRITKKLPNQAITNDEMESFLGLVNDKPSKARKIVLRNNGISTRYYSIDSDGNRTHNNAELTKEAIDLLFDDEFTLDDMEVLSAGSTTPDLLNPGHAVMVHGLYDHKSIELNSASGLCTAGMSAMKFAYLSVKSGNSNNAVCTGSERIATRLLANKFNGEAENLKDLNERPIVAFQREFLRWMLSDGAGAMLLENKKRGELSFKIEWMEAYSYAHEIETCMWAGGEKQSDGSIKSWSDCDPKDWINNSIFNFNQDIKILDKHILVKGVESMDDAMKKHNINGKEITHFLPHISSYFFADRLKELMQEGNLGIEESAWFMNLDKVGNVGAASVYLMLEELAHSGNLKKGEKIFLCVPESGRFSYAYAYLTVC